MTLDQLKIGASGTITSVGGDGPLRCRLLDMGLIPRTRVTLQKIAPMGDPIEIRVRGYELTLRATMGAVFRCPVWTVGAEELSALLKRSGVPLYGAALREDTLDARAVDYSRCAIAIGSEGRGLTEGVLALCDQTIKIPMSEHCESLNAAAAATVLLWEAARND